MNVCAVWVLLWGRHPIIFLINELQKILKCARFCIDDSHDLKFFANVNFHLGSLIFLIYVLASNFTILTFSDAFVERTLNPKQTPPHTQFLQSQDTF